MDEEVFKAGQSPANFLWGPCVSDTGDPMVYFELASWSSGDARHDPAAAPPARHAGGPVAVTGSGSSMSHHHDFKLPPVFRVQRIPSTPKSPVRGSPSSSPIRRPSCGSLAGVMFLGRREELGLKEKLADRVLVIAKVRQTTHSSPVAT